MCAAESAPSSRAWPTAAAKPTHWWPGPSHQFDVPFIVQSRHTAVHPVDAEDVVRVIHPVLHWDAVERDVGNMCHAAILPRLQALQYRHPDFFVEFFVVPSTKTAIISPVPEGGAGGARPRHDARRLLIAGVRLTRER